MIMSGLEEEEVIDTEDVNDKKDNNEQGIDSDSEEDSDEEDKVNQEKELQISAISKKISQDPYMYDCHTERIKLLREVGDLNRLREARDLMSKHFPLTEDLWMDWLKDEIKLVSSSEDRVKVEDLFDKAFQDYQSVPVWLEFVQFAIGGMEEEDGIKRIRETFERALSCVGLHASQGSHIWDAFREFESAVLAGLMPKPGAEVTPEQEQAFSEQNKKLISIFKRQLQVPLLNMQHTLSEYQEWLGEAVDSDTQASFDKALALLTDIQPLEDLISSKSGSEQLQAYQDLLSHEQSKKEPPRILCVFERAIKDHCLVAELWVQYTAYLDKLNSRQQIQSGYDRALRNCPWSAQLWVNYLLALERQGTEFVKMKAVCDKALGVGYSNASDYLMVWLAYCDYLRRRIDWSKEHKEPLETFQLTIEAAVDFMFQNFGKDGDPEGKLRQFWAFVEVKFCKNLERGREIWTQLMQEGHGSEAGLWLQYFRLERMFGDNKHCRKILQKALNSVTDWPEVITQAYIDFEREEGDLEQFDTAKSRCEAQLQRLEERKVKAAEKEALEQKKKTQKKQPDKSKTADPPTQGKEFGKAGKRKLDENFDFKKPADPSKKSEEPVNKKAKQDPEVNQEVAHGATVKHDSSKDHITVFVSNLDFGLEVDRLKDIFHECGEITDVRLVRNYKGKSKGYGYVEFSNSNSVLQALRLDRRPVDNRPMYVSRCEDRTQGVKPAPQFKYATKLEQNKLFVKGLPFTLNQEGVENIFKEHGKLKEVRVVTYRNGHSKGIAYVEYENESDAAQAVLKTDGLLVGDFTISVAISNPPERKPGFATKFDPLLTLGAGKKDTNIRGKARTQVSLVPRSVRQQPSKAPSKPGDKTSASSSSTTNAPASSNMSNNDFRNMLLKK